MCNTYTLRRDFWRARRRGESWQLTERQRQLLDQGEQWVIRPTRPAPVYVEEVGIKLMRWGFERPWAKAINNARMENKGSPTWRQAWDTGRCLIPLSGWYEFTGPAGNMSAHLLEAADGSELLAAGLWEEHPVLGDCFTMLMTASEGAMKEIHDRMPVILSSADGERFTKGEVTELRPSGLEVRSRRVPSPLKKGREPLIQEELF